MTEKHPYTSGPGGVMQVVAQLRRSFPATVTAETLKKLNIAPNNETYVLNILKFLGILDAENNKNATAAPVFNKHDQAEFEEAFSKLVFDAYHELFELHGPGAWELSIDKLVSFFRNHDATSDVVGRRQATTFLTLARIAGKTGDAAPAQANKPRITSSAAANAPKAKLTGKAARVKALPAAASPLAVGQVTAPNSREQASSGMALTVRIEINLPGGGDQATYDHIFKSIRENLLNGSAA